MTFDEAKAYFPEMTYEQKTAKKAGFSGLPPDFFANLYRNLHTINFGGGGPFVPQITAPVIPIYTPPVVPSYTPPAATTFVPSYTPIEAYMPVLPPLVSNVGLPTQYGGGDRTTTNPVTVAPQVHIPSVTFPTTGSKYTPSATMPEWAKSPVGSTPVIQIGPIKGTLKDSGPDFISDPKANYAIYSQPFKHNTEVGNAAAYSTISQRNDYYQWANQELAGKSKWFEAAALVTKWNSVGAAAPDRPNAWFLNDAADKLLQAGNKALFSYNMSNAKHIMNGTLNSSFTDANGQNVSFKGLTGKTLDYALVRYEQTKVQEFLTQYKMTHASADVASAIQSVNGAMGKLGSPWDVFFTIDKHFNTEKGQKAFDFNNYNDRVKLGQEIINKLYNRQ